MNYLGAGLGEYMKNSKRWGIAALVSIGLINVANAGVVLGPVSGTASNTFSGGGTPISNTHDQTGLDTTYVSGVTDWNTYFSGAPLHSTGYTTEWWTDEFVSSAVVIYDLGAVYNIDNFALWEEESSGFASANVLISTDGVTFTSLLSDIEPMPDQPPIVDYPAQFFPFATVAARYIELDLTSCPNAGGTGAFPACAIGQVAFDEVSGVPEPATLALIALGFCGLGFTSFRARRLRSFTA